MTSPIQPPGTPNFKQPRQDVTGVDRSDSYLLSLDDQALKHREALVELTDHLFTATCVGNPAPVVENMYQRITKPVVGDLVVETTRRGRFTDSRTRLMGLGYLIEHRTEWWESDEEWALFLAENDGAADEERTHVEAWYVQYGPDPSDICRWTNAIFRVVPLGLSFRMPLGARQADGSTMVTQDGLLASLAGSGLVPRPRRDPLA